MLITHDPTSLFSIKYWFSHLMTVIIYTFKFGYFCDLVQLVPRAFIKNKDINSPASFFLCGVGCGFLDPTQKHEKRVSNRCNEK